jgi:hypothetical protein
MKAVMNELEKNDDIILSLMKFILLLVQVEQPDLWISTCLKPALAEKSNVLEQQQH